MKKQFPLTVKLFGEQLVALLGLAGLGLFLLVAARAYGSEPCGPPLDRVSYAAGFKWDRSRMELKVGAADRAGLAMGAQIFVAGKCQAACEIKGFETDEKLGPIALDMECQAKGQAGLTTHATVLWASARGSVPLLRTGRWATGYREAVLQVRLDRYSQIVDQPQQAFHLASVALPLQ